MCEENKHQRLLKNLTKHMAAVRDNGVFDRREQMCQPNFGKDGGCYRCELRSIMPSENSLESAPKRGGRSGEVQAADRGT